ncbi:hypothetical protein SS50377_23846 [Spironucleus salmonicida]|uniref:Uncharacterized protein n=1 Tax=Spironucleus salmonicida TaxID=348837 RepID=V6LIK5_9EUKA|nr:hypothetical protein SS50377_23846 [Spironucleus salmonicida]|eukprot:EST44148.1 Hypothetical protein SS50377_16049 [Spironucleus salmonicida]
MRQTKKPPVLNSVPNIMLHYQKDPFLCVSKIQEFLESNPQETVYKYDQFDKFLLNFGKSVQQDPLTSEAIEILQKKREAAQQIRTAKIKILRPISSLQTNVNINLEPQKPKGIKSANNIVMVPYIDNNKVVTRETIPLQVSKNLELNTPVQQNIVSSTQRKPITFQEQNNIFHSFQNQTKHKKLYFSEFDLVLPVQKLETEPIQQHSAISDDFDEESSHNPEVKENFNKISELFAQKYSKETISNSPKPSEHDDFDSSDSFREEQLSILDKLEAMKHEVDASEFEIQSAFDDINVKIDIQSDQNDEFGSFDFGEIGDIQF